MELAKIEEAIKSLLTAIGENPEREGLKETPKRVAKMYQEVLAGIELSNEQIAEKFKKNFKVPTTDDLVIVSDIPCFSYCEHHLALMYDMRITVGYKPKGKVLGLSKVARVADMVCRRLQLQERIGEDIAEIIGMITGSSDIVVFIKAKHSCMTARGIKKENTETKTLTKKGEFKKPEVLAEFLNLIS